MMGAAEMDRPLISEWDVAEPRPEALIESLRAFGYSPEAAIADLIDNSISADARSIDVMFHWDGSDSHVAIVDDGTGMTDAQLLAAMRPGSTSPLQDRGTADLGRFGLGLKTASFSQARELSVLTRAGSGEWAARRWDLDEVAASGEWRLLKTAAAPAMNHFAASGNVRGTVVTWTKCDRLVGTATTSDRKSHQRFLETVERVGRHLPLVFHRFMSGPGKITITLNNAVLQPVDPFLEDHTATQRIGTEHLTIRGQQIEVRPFVLPHRSKLTEAQQRNGGGIGGWNSQQGFYVYRARRLLVAGDWLRLGFTNDEHTKLARIAIDFSPALDHDWQIDVKKSTARPPGPLVEDLRRIARATRSQAESVYRHRGKLIARRTSRQYVHAWTEVVARDGTVTYRLNRQHPVVVQALQGPDQQRRNIERLLRFAEETVPTTMIGVHIADALENQHRPYGHSAHDLQKLLAFTFGQMTADGSTVDQALEMLATVEPFAGYPEIIQTLKEQNSADDG